jgi:hypothetical protein
MNGSHDMSSPAFRNLIAINTPTPDERTPSMNPSTLLVDDHIRELRQVASDLHNERVLAPAKADGPGRIRVAVGEALVQLGIAVAAGNRRPTTQVN